ncbi:unnamed protein product [Bemisia tabaci]|uniref:Uncharacterized protein n=1 Tax=Bemisia tabaci TaxID=7038 RepID=A0A9P0A981_BEMTA|nr:PREDICTED: uncharacterized protein LOC109043844 [Bemisia tabaci]CAH0386891.1 unnamed protein product [Bemisia tabaci]
MIYTCKCLNVEIHAKCVKLESVYELFPDLILEKNDPFFKEDLVGIQFEKVNVQQCNLVSTRECGSWILNYCINCSTNTHAVSLEKNTVILLVHKSLMRDPSEVSLLRLSENFSPVFNIIVDPVSDTLSPIPAKLSVSKSLQPALATLHRQLENYIQQKTVETEQTIQKFKEEQYLKLDNMKTLALQNHQALMRVLVESNSSSNSSFELSTEDWQPLNPAPSKVEKPQVLKQSSSIQTPSKSEMNFSPIKGSQPMAMARPRVLSNCVAASLDSEGLFTLEGMEDENTNIEQPVASEDELSDTDDSGSHDEGIHIPRRRLSSFAKSMPVNVPVFDFEGHDDRKKLNRPKSPAKPAEIAASMKALAKSVHGDTVFGDLPRPRFSSQL